MAKVFNFLFAPIFWYIVTFQGGIIVESLFSIIPVLLGWMLRLLIIQGLLIVFYIVHHTFIIIRYSQSKDGMAFFKETLKKNRSKDERLKAISHFIHQSYQDNQSDYIIHLVLKLMAFWPYKIYLKYRGEYAKDLSDDPRIGRHARHIESGMTGIITEVWGFRSDASIYFCIEADGQSQEGQAHEFVVLDESPKRGGKIHV